METSQDLTHHHPGRSSVEPLGEGTLWGGCAPTCLWHQPPVLPWDRQPCAKCMGNGPRLHSCREQGGIAAPEHPEGHQGYSRGGTPQTHTAFILSHPQNPLPNQKAKCSEVLWCCTVTASRKHINIVTELSKRDLGETPGPYLWYIYTCNFGFEQHL